MALQSSASNRIWLTVWLVLAFFGLSLGACRGEHLKEETRPIDKNIQGERGKLIVSHHTLDANYLDYTLENHPAYAKKNAYDYWFRNGKIDNGMFTDENGRNKIFKQGLYWQKIVAVKQGMEIKNADGTYRYDWVMWIDADAFFTNFNKKIEDVLEKASPNDFLIIARDFPTSDCINSGVWLIKNNNNGRQFIETVEKSFPYYKNNSWPEQDAMQEIIYGYVSKTDIEKNTVAPYKKRGCEEARIIKGVQVVPQRVLNSFYTRYAVGAEGSAWQPGDYIAHFAGEPDRLALIKRLMACMKAEAPELKGCEVNGSWHPQ